MKSLKFIIDVLRRQKMESYNMFNDNQIRKKEWKMRKETNNKNNTLKLVTNMVDLKQTINGDFKCE